MGDELHAMQRKFDSRFAALARVNAGERAQQQANIARVSSDIAPLVLAFFAEHAGRTFFVAELQEYVAARHVGSHASADRVMRLLRSPKGGRQINYDCINRARSLYQILPALKGGAA